MGKYQLKCEYFSGVGGGKDKVLCQCKLGIELCPDDCACYDGPPREKPIPLGKYQVRCRYYSGMGGGQDGALSCCKLGLKLCPVDCNSFDDPNRRTYYSDAPIMDFGAGGARWHRVD